MSGRLKKNTLKLDALNNATCLETPPKMDVETGQQSMKKRIWAHLPPLSITLASPGRLWGYPSHENAQQIQENVSTKPTSKGEKNDAVRQWSSVLPPHKKLK